MNTDRKFLLLSSGIIAVCTIAMILARVFSSVALLSNDSYTYLAFVRSAMEKGWLASLDEFPVMKDIPPLLSVLLCCGCRCGLDPESFGLALNYAGILLACQGVLFCSFRIFRNRFTALAAAVMVCSLPKIYIEGCNIQRDPLFWAESAWLLYTMLCLAGSETDSPDHEKRHCFRLTLSASLLSALSCLTRKEGLPLLCLTMLCLILVFYRKKRLSRKYRIFLIVLFAVVSTAVIYLPVCFGIPFKPGSFLSRISEYLIHV